jgi:hypothetical protein
VSKWQQGDNNSGERQPEQSVNQQQAIMPRQPPESSQEVDGSAYHCAMTATAQG